MWLRNNSRHWWGQPIAVTLVSDLQMKGAPFNSHLTCEIHTLSTDTVTCAKVILVHSPPSALFHSHPSVAFSLSYPLPLEFNFALICISIYQQTEAWSATGSYLIHHSMHWGILARRIIWHNILPLSHGNSNLTGDWHLTTAFRGPRT